LIVTTPLAGADGDAGLLVHPNAMTLTHIVSRTAGSGFTTASTGPVSQPHVVAARKLIGDSPRAFV
jgi:hypothetical protein